MPRSACRGQKVSSQNSDCVLQKVDFCPSRGPDAPFNASKSVTRNPFTPRMPAHVPRLAFEPWAGMPSRKTNGCPRAPSVGEPGVVYEPSLISLTAALSRPSPFLPNPQSRLRQQSKSPKQVYRIYAFLTVQLAFRKEGFLGATLWFPQIAVCTFSCLCPWLNSISTPRRLRRRWRILFWQWIR